MESQANMEYRFIMVYQDHVTKFVQIKALKTKRIKEVVKHIIDIFCIIGVPMLLQYDIGIELVNLIIHDLKCTRDNLKIIYGKSQHSHRKIVLKR